MKTDEQIKQSVLKKVFADEIKKAEWATQISLCFFEKVGFMFILNGSIDNPQFFLRNDLRMGVYRIDIREPEHSTFKFDLTQIAPEKDDKLKQIQITLREENLMDIAKAIYGEKLDRAIDLTIQEMRKVKK